MNTRFSEIIQYFKTLASQHVAIGHSLNEKHFYRFELEEILSNLKNVNYPALILEGYRYSLTDKSSDNVMKERTGAFVLIDHMSDMGDFDAMHEVWDNMETICDEIIARIKSDKRNSTIRSIRDFDLGSVQVALIANETDKNFGIRCTFTITSSFTTDVDAAMWNLEAEVPE